VSDDDHDDGTAAAVRKALRERARGWISGNKFTLGTLAAVANLVLHVLRTPSHTHRCRYIYIFGCFVSGRFYTPSQPRFPNRLLPLPPSLVTQAVLLLGFTGHNRGVYRYRGNRPRPMTVTRQKRRFANENRNVQTETKTCRMKSTYNENQGRHVIK